MTNKILPLVLELTSDNIYLLKTATDIKLPKIGRYIFEADSKLECADKEAFIFEYLYAKDDVTILVSNYFSEMQGNVSAEIISLSSKEIIIPKDTLLGQYIKTYNYKNLHVIEDLLDYVKHFDELGVKIFAKENVIDSISRNKDEYENKIFINLKQP